MLAIAAPTITYLALASVFLGMGPPVFPATCGLLTVRVICVPKVLNLSYRKRPFEAELAALEPLGAPLQPAIIVPFKAPDAWSLCLSPSLVLSLCLSLSLCTSAVAFAAGKAGDDQR
jgi:hypothetical protein